MRAITICQPYAHLIVTGAKRVENRTWPTRVTGPVAIHAGKSREWLELSDDGTRDEYYDLPLADMAFGAVVGVADLVACLPIEEIRRGDHDARFPWLRDHEHAEGPFCFVLENVRRIEPVPFKGAQGFFFVPDSVRAIEEEMRRKQSAPEPEDEPRPHDADCDGSVGTFNRGTGGGRRVIRSTRNLGG